MSVPHSRVYEGRVRHHRRAPVEHAFSYSMYMMYLDLSELERVFEGRWLWSAGRGNVVSFRREDHMGDPSLPLDECVREFVRGETGVRPGGPIRLLTHLRNFGYVMNPVSFYYCFNAGGETVEMVVAEVHNTPWGETHCYVCDVRKAPAAHFRFPKAFHVSPFMGMEQEYRWRLSAPGGKVWVHMENHEGGEKVFSATMSLGERAITAGTLARVLMKFPFMTGKVIGAIYWQAFRLWIKGVPFQTHPKNRLAPKAGAA